MQQVEEAIVGTINEAIKFKIDQRSVVYPTHGYKSFNCKRCVRLLYCMLAGGIKELLNTLGCCFTLC